MSAKERNFKRFNRLAMVGMLGLVLGTSGLMPESGASDAASEEYRVEYFKAVAPIALIRLQENISKFNNLIESQKFLVNFSNVYELNGNEQKLKEISRELANVLETVDANPNIFDVEQDRQDLNMYFPIYKAAGEKFDIPWYLLWVIHQQESTVSRDESAFVVDSDWQYGAMQRATTLHFEENVTFATRGLEYLAQLPQRYPDDWREIAWAAMKISEDRQTTGTILSALARYSSYENALNRWDRALMLQSLFGGNLKD